MDSAGLGGSVPTKAEVCQTSHAQQEPTGRAERPGAQGGVGWPRQPQRAA